MSGPTPEEEAQLVGYRPDAHREVSKSFAEGQNEYYERLLEDNWHKGDRGRRVALANAFVNFASPLDEAVKRAGLHWGLLFERGEQGLTELVSSIPIIDVDTQLQRLRREASQRAWEANDLNDLDFLSTSIVYCDAVVTEKKWIALARRARLGDKYGTGFASTPGDLIGLLLAAGADG